jgi:hypothetical protein
MTRSVTPMARPPTTGGHVLTPEKLRTLVRGGAGTATLTVYVDTRVTDPAMRHAWRPALTAALREARASASVASELAAFDRAAEVLEGETRALGGLWGAPGWVAFVTPEGPLYAGDIPVRVPTLAVWRDGPVVSLYLRGLKQQRPAVVVLVDSRSARLFRYAGGTLTAFPSLSLATSEAPTAAPRSPDHEQRVTPPPRGPLDPERVRRRQHALFRRLLPPLSARVATLAGEDGWVLIAGTPEWAALAAATLSTQFVERVLLSESLDRDATDDEIATAARRAASELRAAHGRGQVGRLLERALPRGRAELGVPATQRALHEHAVDLLFLTPDFLRAHDRAAEDAVHAAIAQGADIEVLSGGAAVFLDEVADGIAARLRFALDGRSHPRRRRAVHP